MFNDITAAQVGTTKYNDTKLASSQNNEDIVIFDNNTLSEQPVVQLSKKELKELEKQQKKAIKNTPDGIIQKGRQGSSAGDCWLLSQINSIATTEWGKEAFKNLIKHDQEKGTYSLYFKGIDKTYEFTQKEFDRAKRRSDLSSGDADVLLIEMAVEKHFQEENLNNKSLWGNEVVGVDSLNYMLTGVTGKKTTQSATYEQVLKEMGKNPDTNNNLAATCVYRDPSSSVNDVHSQHAYAIQRVELDENGEIDTIHIVDPYYPTHVQKKSLKSFKNNLLIVGFLDGRKIDNN